MPELQISPNAKIVKEPFLISNSITKLRNYLVF